MEPATEPQPMTPWARAVLDSALSPTVRIVALHVETIADLQMPGAEIAQDLHLDVNTVYRSLRRLEHEGWIEVHRDTRAHSYTTVGPPDPPPSPPQTTNGHQAAAPEWLTAHEAARRIDVDTRTLYVLVDAGTLRAYRVAGRIQIRQTDVDAHLHGNRS